MLNTICVIEIIVKIKCALPDLGKQRNNANAIEHRLVKYIIGK